MISEKLTFQKDPNIGLFGFATDKFCLINKFVTRKDVKRIKDVLKVDIIKCSLLGTPLIGIFVSGNSNGVILSNLIYENEIKHLEKQTDVLVLNTNYTAMGNLVLANDKGCVISAKLKTYIKEIGDFLKVKVGIGTIAGLDLVGSLAVCNNKGCIIHKGATKEEVKFISRILKVNTDKGMVNFGNSWVKSGLIANSNGFLIGNQTTGPEVGRCSEVLGFL